MTNLQAVIIGACILGAGGLIGGMSGGRYVPLGAKGAVLDTLLGEVRLSSPNKLIADRQAVRDAQAAKERAGLEDYYQRHSFPKAQAYKDSVEMIERRYAPVDPSTLTIGQALDQADK